MRQNRKIAKGCSKKPGYGDEFAGFDLRERGLGYYMDLADDIKSSFQFAQAHTGSRPALRKSMAR